MSMQLNLATLVTNSAIRKGVMYNGREHIVIPSPTLPFNVVMNEILYTEDQILANYEKLDNTPAPISHPVDSSGNFISAKTPEGYNLGYIGAWNRNARIEGSRVGSEVWVDVERAKESEKGRELLARVDKGEPISTSIAVLAKLIKTNGSNYKSIAEIYDIDHNAILLHEPPAATTDQGVGLLVNTATAVSIEDVEEESSSFKEWLKDLFKANEKENKVEEKLKEKEARIKELEAQIAELKDGKKEEKKEEPEVKANESSEADNALLKRLEELEATIKANEDAKLAGKREKVAKILGNEEVVKEMKEDALDAIIANSGGTANLLPNEAGGGSKEEKISIENHFGELK